MAQVYLKAHRRLFKEVESADRIGKLRAECQLWSCFAVSVVTMSRSSDYDYRVRHRNYTYVPRNFNPREVRRLDLEEDDSPPLDLDCDERLFRSRPDTATNLRLDEIERAVMELDPRKYSTVVSSCSFAVD